MEIKDIKGDDRDKETWREGQTRQRNIERRAIETEDEAKSRGAIVCNNYYKNVNHLEHLRLHG